jgi:hypothetical protein
MSRGEPIGIRRCRSAPGRRRSHTNGNSADRSRYRRSRSPDSRETTGQHRGCSTSPHTRGRTRSRHCKIRSDRSGPRDMRARRNRNCPDRSTDRRRRTHSKLRGRRPRRGNSPNRHWERGRRTASRDSRRKRRRRRSSRDRKSEGSPVWRQSTFVRSTNHRRRSSRRTRHNCWDLRSRRIDRRNTIREGWGRSRIARRWANRPSTPGRCKHRCSECIGLRSRRRRWCPHPPAGRRRRYRCDTFAVDTIPRRSSFRPGSPDPTGSGPRPRRLPSTRRRHSQLRPWDREGRNLYNFEDRWRGRRRTRGCNRPRCRRPPTRTTPGFLRCPLRSPLPHRRNPGWGRTHVLANMWCRVHTHCRTTSSCSDRSRYRRTIPRNTDPSHRSAGTRCHPMRADKLEGRNR